MFEIDLNKTAAEMVGKDRTFDFNHITLPPPKPSTCPAKCRRSGLCYGKAYFLGRAGAGVECDPKNCQWKENRGAINSSKPLVLETDALAFARTNV